MNKSAEEMVGYEREELHGKKYYEMNLWSVNDLSMIQAVDLLSFPAENHCPANGARL